MFRRFLSLWCVLVLVLLCCSYASAGGLADLMREYGATVEAPRAIQARFATLQTPAPAAALPATAAPGAACADGSCQQAPAAVAAPPPRRLLSGRTSAQALRRTASDCSTGGCNRR